MAMASEMTQRYVDTNGIRMHIVEQGEGPLVVLLHGFPGTWYSWRYQIPALAKAGYHAVAPDLRGYGQTDVPEGIENYTTFSVVGDLIGLLDTLNTDQAFVVGHDWGAQVARDLCLFRPDRVKAYIALAVPFFSRSDGPAPVESLTAMFGDGYYVARFQEPGRAEADFARYDYKTLWKKLLILFNGPRNPIASQKQEITDLVEVPARLPSWIHEEELDYYAEQFSASGFTGPLNYYRAMDLSWKLKAPWLRAKVYVPTLFLTGDEDIGYNLFDTPDYIHESLKQVPGLQRTVVLPRTGHFMQEENPSETSKNIIGFLDSYKQIV